MKVNMLKNYKHAWFFDIDFCQSGVKRWIDMFPRLLDVQAMSLVFVPNMLSGLDAWYI
jgi:hypothetical protein